MLRDQSLSKNILCECFIWCYPASSRLQTGVALYSGGRGRKFTKSPGAILDRKATRRARRRDAPSQIFSPRPKFPSNIHIVIVSSTEHCLGSASPPRFSQSACSPLIELNVTNRPTLELIFTNYPAHLCRPDERFRGPPRFFAALPPAFVPGRAPPRPVARCEPPLLTGSALMRKSGS
jgi:hypothetical protein